MKTIKSWNLLSWKEPTRILKILPGPTQDNHHQSHPVPESIVEMLQELQQAQSHGHSLGSQGLFPKVYLDPGTREFPQDWKQLHSPLVLFPVPSHVNRPHTLILLQCSGFEVWKSQLSTQQPHLLLLISPSLLQLGAGMEMPGICLAWWVSRNIGSVGALSTPPHPNARALTQWSLKSPTTTAGAKDLAGFMEQPV